MNPLPPDVDLELEPHPHLSSDFVTKLYDSSPSGTAFARKLLSSLYTNPAVLTNRSIFASDKNARGKHPLTPSKVHFMLYHTLQKFPEMGQCREASVAKIKSALYDKLNKIPSEVSPANASFSQQVFYPATTPQPDVNQKQPASGSSSGCFMPPETPRIPRESFRIHQPFQFGYNYGQQ